MGVTEASGNRTLSGCIADPVLLCGKDSQLQPCLSFSQATSAGHGSSMRPVPDEGGVRSLAALEKLPPPAIEPPLKALLRRDAELAMRPAAGGVSSGPPPPPPRPCAPPPAADDDRSAALPE